MTELPPLLRVADLAEALHITRHGARAILRRQEIPCSKVGRNWIVRRDALLKHLEKQERAHRAPPPNADSAVRHLASLPPPRRRRAIAINAQEAPAMNGGNDAAAER